MVGYGVNRSVYFDAHTFDIMQLKTFVTDVL